MTCLLLDQIRARSVDRARPLMAYQCGSIHLPVAGLNVLNFLKGKAIFKQGMIRHVDEIDPLTCQHFAPFQSYQWHET